MQALSAIANAVRAALGLVLPVFATAADFRRWNPWVWRILHLLVLAGVLTLMWWLNQHFEVGYFLQNVPEAYRQFFLPVLFLLVYALSWLAYWLWQLFGEEEAAADFPDVADAWRDAVRALDAAGVGLADAPLFLILGRPEAGTDALLQAAQANTTVRAPN